MEDFFISYNKADKVWAEGLANWLDQSLYTTILQEQDFVPSTNFVVEMHNALKSASRMILVLSPDYLSAKFPLAEWTAQFATDPSCERGVMIPVRVRECTPDGLLRPIIYIDLVGLSEDIARRVFLEGIKSVINRKRPMSELTQQPTNAKKTRKPRLSQKIKGNNNTNIQAEQIHNITIKTSGKKLPSIQPPDVVGANVEMRAYIEYLVDRYIDWRKKGIERGIDKRPFHPSMIHRDIKRDFAARTYLVPQGRFNDLVHYIQVRINDTITGRNNPHRNYHSFDEHLIKLRGIGGNKDVVTYLLDNLSAARKKALSNACNNNLRRIAAAKMQWMLENRMLADAIPTEENLKVYLKEGALPKCPLGGSYIINSLGQEPTCMVAGHHL